jgi:outer membrane protein
MFVLPGRAYHRGMRTVLAVAVIGLGLLLATPARAQFQNHSIGIRVGYIWESDDLNLQPTFPIPAFGINGSYYIENGFDIFAALDFGIQRNVPYQNQTFVIYPEVGVRYFFWEDYFRPYAGVQMSYIHTFFNNDDSGNPVTDVTDNLLGAGVMGGVEYSLTDQLAIGGSLELVALWWLNTPVYYEPRGFVRLSTNF